MWDWFRRLEPWQRYSLARWLIWLLVGVPLVVGVLVLGDLTGFVLIAFLVALAAFTIAVQFLDRKANWSFIDENPHLGRWLRPGRWGHEGEGGRLTIEYVLLWRWLRRASQAPLRLARSVFGRTGADDR